MSRGLKKKEMGIATADEIAELDALDAKAAKIDPNSKIPQQLKANTLLRQQNFFAGCNSGLIRVRRKRNKR